MRPPIQQARIEAPKTAIALPVATLTRNQCVTGVLLASQNAARTQCQS